MQGFSFKLIAHIFRSQRYFDRLSINYNAQQMIATLNKVSVASAPLSHQDPSTQKPSNPQTQKPSTKKTALPDSLSTKIFTFCQRRLHRTVNTPLTVRSTPR
jgi:hypothetical protein